MPALLVTALEVASDASDALLAALLRGSAEPVLVATQIVAACLLITVEILVWSVSNNFIRRSLYFSIIYIEYTHDYGPWQQY